MHIADLQTQMLPAIRNTPPLKKAYERLNTLISQKNVQAYILIGKERVNVICFRFLDSHRILAYGDKNTVITYYHPIHVIICGKDYTL